jgi:hypothetical protein
VWRKLLRWGGEFIAFVLRAVFRVDNVPAVAVGITEMHSLARGAVKLVRGLIVP